MSVTHIHRCVLAAAVAWLCSVPGHAKADVEAQYEPPPSPIRDLDYGDVLFHYFQGEHFDALVRLEVARDLRRIPHHEAEAELLSGGLYLSLGLPDEAAKVFNRVLAGPVPQSVGDRAFYYLARISYQRGYTSEAARYLARVRGALPGELEQERRLLASNVLIAQGRLSEAATELQGVADAGGWAAYARFNLGVTLIRSGDVARGHQLLESVGTMAAASEEQLALRDRANLALGFAALQQHLPDSAVAALERVRFDGPFTNRALLAMGWAHLDAKRPEQALVPWLALRDRPLLDSAVQESFLAVPYAYTQLASSAQAAASYRAAIEAYAAENRRIDESIAAIRAGGFLDSVLASAPRSDDIGWFWQLQNLPDSPQTRYLYRLLASHEFQEGLKNYRDLRALSANLERWRGSLEAFGEAAAVRRAVAMHAQPRVQRVLAGTDLAELERRQSELQARLSAVAADRDVAALVVGDEARQWQALARIESAVQAMPPGDQRESLADRARVLRGTLLWKLDADYDVRLDRLQSELRGSGAALAVAANLAAAVQQSSAGDPSRTGDSASRVDALAMRVEALQPRLDAAAAAEERALANLAVRELEAEKRRLGNYAAQAQFALASLYDAAASGETR
jgi:hypothetical protein